MRPIEVIHLNRHDTVGVVCELLQEATPGGQVWLVAPWRAEMLNNLFNMKRLRRAAEQAGVELRLVTTHLQTRALARESGLYVHASVPLRLRKYRRQRALEAKGLAARIVPAQEQLGRRWQRRPHIGVGTVLVSLVIIALVVALLAAGAAALAPGATVTLEPVAKLVAGELTVSAVNLNSSVDYGKATIPARVVQVIASGVGETTATGRTDVAGERASGEVVFVNRTTAPVAVPKGTLVRTGSGTNVRFYTVMDVEVPGTLYAYRRVGVIALEPGPAGNVKALTINVMEGDLATQVEVLNDTPTTGGTIKGVPMVAAADFDTALAVTLRKLQDEAYSQLASELVLGEYIPPETVSASIMERYFDQVLGEQSDVVVTRMKVVVRGLAIDGQGLESLVAQSLTAQADEGMALIDGSLEYKRSEQERVSTGEVRFKVTASGMFAPVIDERAIKANLRGKTVPEAQQWLAENLALRAAPTVEVTPGWWQYLPWLPARTTVVISAHEGE